MDEEKDYGFTGYNRKLLESARELRKNMTPQEYKLWYIYLKNYPIKFYRQRIIDSYIVDFYCSCAKLVIEVDGSQHYTKDGVEYDRIRTSVLEKYGLEVLRFSNDDINKNLTGVCLEIDKTVKQRMKEK